MAIDPKISILTFPQKLMGNVLHLNVLIIPRNIDPFEPWPETGAPAWTNANLQLQAVTISGLDKLPYISPPTLPPVKLVGVGIPAEAAALFTVLRDKFNIVPAPPGSKKRLQKPEANDFARKYLPVTYRTAFNFTNPRTRDAVIDDSYHCAIKANDKKNPAFVPSGNDVSWGEVFAYCLRQPALARKVGFIYETSIPVNDTLFAEGGWLFTDIVDEGSYGTAADKAYVKRYAARIPALKPGEDRNIFAAVLFPVKENDTDIDPLGLDTIFPEASAYDDGFAKIVHASQPVSANLLQEEADDNPPIHDVGIRLGWDDEQILIWLNRQLRADPNDATKQKRLDVPMGVFQYRVDAREKAIGDGVENEWTPLTLVRNKADIALDANNPATIIDAKENTRELGVEVYPVKLDGHATSHYWLPAYYTQWIGKSLVLPDMDAAELYMTNAAGVGLGNLYSPVDEEVIKLQYGKNYEFRVRLSDPTGGGPGFTNEAINKPVYESPAPVTSCSFRRHVVPQRLHILNPLPKTDGVYFTDELLQLQRPRLGYPSVVFTGKYGHEVMQLLRADRDMATQFAQDPVTKEVTTMSREFGLHDPDVDRVEITIEVKALEMDTLLSTTKTEAYIHLYTTRRAFADPAFASVLDIPVQYVDAPVLNFDTSSPILQDLGLSNEVEPENIHNIQRIVLPTARIIRISLRALCTDTINYYGDDRFRFGKSFSFMAHKPSVVETGLIKNNVDTEEIKGIYLQPDPELLNDPKFFESFFLGDMFRDDEKEKQPDLIQRLAQQLGVQNKGFSLVAKPGKRVQFGCSRGIRNSIAPDGTSITFSTKADLLNHWIVPIKLSLNRDWTWDGLDVVSLQVERKQWFRSKAKPAVGQIVGDIEMKKIINIQALKKPDRSQTNLIFIDAVEPKPAPGDNPDIVHVEYTVRPLFKAGHAASRDGDTIFELELPVTTPPFQVPRIVSAGLAFSKYKRADNYSSTEPRQKFLWLELSEPLKDPNDAYFVRVLAYAPDPLLSDWRGELFKSPKNPPLPIDPEPIRIITTNQPEDNSGLDAMQEMTAVGGDKKCHYIVPLPPGLHADSPELFGFFSYELRVGHRHIWSTAQGRYGRPLVTAGVQHAAPTIFCTVDRNEINITVTAPYALAVHNGKNVTSRPPRTQLWSLLYAQVPQADGNDFRNILLDDRLMVLQPKTDLSIRRINEDAHSIALGGWDNKEVIQLLKQLGLPEDASLSVLCVEMLPVVFTLFQTQGNTRSGEQQPGTLSEHDLQTALINHIQTRFGPVERSASTVAEQSEFDAAIANQIRPLSNQLGNYRILRTSPLVPVPALCCVDC